jgi:glucan phosphorylase
LEKSSTWSLSWNGIQESLRISGAGESIQFPSVRESVEESPMMKSTESSGGEQRAGTERLSQGTGPGTKVREFTRDFVRHLFYTQGRTLETATPQDLYMALACAVRNQLLERWLHTVDNYNKPGVRIVSYLSAEFLLGPHLENNLVNLGIDEQACNALEDLGLDLGKIIEQEEEPGLGNGGLGRLAACYLDSLATLEIPAVGYGIRYEFGILIRSFGTAGSRK